ncbi:MAG: cytochrome ubiquinol oxidase subunit I [Armatimonadota bacterium]
MDPVLLSRIQFGLMIGFHFIFAPLVIGLSWLIVWIVSRYRKTGDAAYGQLARFWVRILGLTFAVGVAMGIAMEFQFGTNWAAYSRFVGDIFGAPLAAEGIFAFFLESVFLGVLLFGWDRVTPRMHLLAAVLVASGATLSAFWILVANSWMQTPAGYTLRNGRAELTDFAAALFNASIFPRFLHTVTGALLTGAVFMLGITAWFLLKGKHQATSRHILTVTLIVSFVTAVAQLGFGHYHAVQVALTQPEKLAAFEGLFTTQTHAPLLLFGIIDGKRETVRYALRIPSGLSLLVSFRADTRITGLSEFPRSEWPPLALTFYPFHLMFYLGLFFIGFTALGVLLLRQRRLHASRWYLYGCWLIIPLPFIANELGWLAAEAGRQPWIVYRVMLTRDAISVSVPAGHILLTLIAFTVIYTGLFVFWLAFLRREVALGPEEPDTPATEVNR